MGKPRVILDEDHEVVYVRVAAVDVAEASGVVCMRVPDPGRPGRFVLVSASQAKNLKGRPKTDRLDAMWLARLTQRGMLRPSFVPPAAIRAVRDFTRARQDLVRERTRVLQRLEKLLEDAMVKITAVAADGLKAKSAVAMVQALIGGERDPHKLADLAKGPLRAKKAELAEALDGMSGSRHAVIAQALLDQVSFLDQRIGQMEAGAIAALAQVKESWGVDATGETGPQAGTSPGSPVLAAAHRLAEIPGISLWLAIVIIAEIGLDMKVFPTPAHLVSWTGLCRTARQSGTRHGKGSQKKGNSYARAAGQAALGASGTGTFLGERYRRIARRRGKAIAQVAAARSIMIIVWHLLADPEARCRDLGADWHTRHINRDKKIRTHIQGLQALGLTVTITEDQQAA